MVEQDTKVFFRNVNWHEASQLNRYKMADDYDT